MLATDLAPMPVFSHHLRQERALHPALTDDLAALLAEIALAGKIIAREVGRAALTGRLGYTGETNVHGEAVYEAAPLGLVAEQAGGRASTGTERILEIEAIDFHQRVPLLLGSPEEVGRAESFHRRTPS